MIPIVSIVGKSNSGKTTFIEKLIRELKIRKFRVGTIKHDVHDFEIDHEGKDTFRHAQAGSDIVVIASRDKMAMIKKLNAELTIDEISNWLMKGVDIVITEGYKSDNKPKIEILRKGMSEDLLCPKDELLAVVSNRKLNSDVPCFDLDDAKGVCDLIERRVLK